VNFLIWLGSLPPLEAVFTYYSKDALALSFCSAEKPDDSRVERTFAPAAGSLTPVSPFAKGNCNGEDLVYAASR
jgi:hypothetical protein